MKSTPIMLGLNFQIKPIKYNNQNQYIDLVGMNYTLHHQSNNTIVHKAIAKNTHVLKLSDYSFTLKLLIHLYRRNLTKNQITIVNNNWMLSEVLAHLIPFWASFSFPTGKYTIAQLKHIAHYHHQHHIDLDIIPADFTSSKMYFIIEQLYHIMNRFSHLRIEYVGTKSAREALDLASAMQEMMKD